jgi:hypothetical protein
MCRQVPVRRSTAGDKSNDNVGGVAVEVLAAAVVDRGGARVCVTSCELDVAQWDASFEGGQEPHQQP